MSAIAQCMILLSAMAVFFGSCSSSDSSSREEVIENQTKDFEKMSDRFIDCLNNGSYAFKSSLQEDFYLYRESLTQYQDSPTAKNRDSYLLLRKIVEQRLDDCL